MTNRIAIVLVLMILAGLAYDGIYHDFSGTMIVLHKLMDLIEYLAFWR